MKHCEKCNQSKPKDDFYDQSLRSKFGVVCRSCKGISGPRKYKKNKPSSKDRKFEKTKVRFTFKIGKEYKISYTNMYGTSSERTIKVKDLDGKFIKAFDSHYNKIITFRKDRVGKSKEV